MILCIYLSEMYEINPYQVHILQTFCYLCCILLHALYLIDCARFKGPTSTPSGADGPLRWAPCWHRDIFSLGIILLFIIQRQNTLPMFCIIFSTNNTYWQISMRNQISSTIDKTQQLLHMKCSKTSSNGSRTMKMNIWKKMLQFLNCNVPNGLNATLIYSSTLHHSCTLKGDGLLYCKQEKNVILSEQTQYHAYLKSSCKKLLEYFDHYLFSTNNKKSVNINEDAKGFIHENGYRYVVSKISNILPTPDVLKEHAQAQLAWNFHMRANRGAFWGIVLNRSIFPRLGHALYS